jgi:hypothetical protein
MLAVDSWLDNEPYSFFHLLINPLRLRALVGFSRVSIPSMAGIEKNLLRQLTTINRVAVVRSGAKGALKKERALTS